jgi:hypothetical protein
MIDSQNGPAKAKLLKMHRKKLIRGQDLRLCGFRITINRRTGSVMVNQHRNPFAEGAGRARIDLLFKPANFE